MTASQIQVPEISDSELAFGTTKALPPYEGVRALYGRDNRFAKIASGLFFKGGSVEQYGLKVREGLDRAAVYRAISAHLRSSEPSHEHKEAGVAAMIDAWFEEGDPA